MSDILGTLNNGADLAANANRFLSVLSRPDFWVRFGIAFAGVNLIIFGVVMFILSDRQVQQAATNIGKIAATKTPVGAGVVAATEVLS